MSTDDVSAIIAVSASEGSDAASAIRREDEPTPVAVPAAAPNTQAPTPTTQPTSEGAGPTVQGGEAAKTTTTGGGSRSSPPVAVNIDTDMSAEITTAPSTVTPASSPPPRPAGSPAPEATQASHPSAAPLPPRVASLSMDRFPFSMDLLCLGVGDETAAVYGGGGAADATAASSFVLVVDGNPLLLFGCGFGAVREYRAAFGPAALLPRHIFVHSAAPHQTAELPTALMAERGRQLRLFGADEAACLLNVLAEEGVCDAVDAQCTAMTVQSPQHQHHGREGSGSPRADRCVHGMLCHFVPLVASEPAHIAADSTQTDALVAAGRLTPVLYSEREGAPTDVLLLSCLRTAPGSFAATLWLQQTIPGTNGGSSWCSTRRRPILTVADQVCGDAAVLHQLLAGPLGPHDPSASPQRMLAVLPCQVPAGGHEGPSGYTPASSAAARMYRRLMMGPAPTAQPPACFAQTPPPESGPTPPTAAAGLQTTCIPHEDLVNYLWWFHARAAEGRAPPPPVVLCSAHQTALGSLAPHPVEELGLRVAHTGGLCAVTGRGEPAHVGSLPPHSPQLAIPPPPATVAVTTHPAAASDTFSRTRSAVSTHDHQEHAAPPAAQGTGLAAASGIVSTPREPSRNADSRLPVPSVGTDGERSPAVLFAEDLYRDEAASDSLSDAHVLRADGSNDSPTAGPRRAGVTSAAPRSITFYSNENRTLRGKSLKLVVTPAQDHSPSAFGAVRSRVAERLGIAHPHRLLLVEATVAAGGSSTISATAISALCEIPDHAAVVVTARNGREFSITRLPNSLRLRPQLPSAVRQRPVAASPSKGALSRPPSRALLSSSSMPDPAEHIDSSEEVEVRLTLPRKQLVQSLLGNTPSGGTANSSGTGGSLDLMNVPTRFSVKIIRPPAIQQHS